jgi:hypothetical protein
MCLQWSGQRQSELPRIRMGADSGEELASRAARHAAHRFDYSKLIPKLKDILRLKNEPLGGGKTELIERIERYDDGELLQRFIHPMSEEDEERVSECWRKCAEAGTDVFHRRSFLRFNGQVSQPFNLQASSVKRLDDHADRNAVDKYLNDELIDYFSRAFVER